MTVYVIPVESGGEPPDGTILHYYPPVEKRRQGGQYAVQRRDSGTSFFYVEEWSDGTNPLQYSKGTKLSQEQIKEHMNAIVEDLPFLCEDAPEREVPDRVLELLDEINERLEEVLALGFHTFKPDGQNGVLSVRKLSDDDLSLLPDHVAHLRSPIVEEETDGEEQELGEDEPIAQRAVALAAQLQVHDGTGGVRRAPLLDSMEDECKYRPLKDKVLDLVHETEESAAMLREFVIAARATNAPDALYVASAAERQAEKLEREAQEVRQRLW